ncbi:putative membrane protein [Sulfurospirillum diekertiae]|uniref:Membrane protein n=2 Tax=Sulfurospirillum diekertiae TaxID=1854492 RepID=A0A290HPK1_9BACT|nr:MULTISPECIES: hypothetical protein [Sulfurospirillum]ATB69658.1 putative membrane protein [Sulfurospirillum diekertiae]WNZ00309.1 hypothetical protein SUSP_002726 [Sulfurospirillum sp. 'SP']WNZ00362.1 hypothetical protein SUSP_002779 [Sulfurospirillum sp. 'SP']
MSSFQIDFLGMSIMNNTPVHFFLSGIMIGLFVWATFFANEEQKVKAVKIMKVWFALVLLSGCYVWTLVPFSIPLLIKSVGGIFLFWFMLQIVKDPTSKPFWGLAVLTTIVGLGLAFTVI